MFSAGHISPGSWKRDDDKTSEYLDLKYWTDLAQLLEKGKFNGLFIADVLGQYDVYGGNGDAATRTGSQFGCSDPSLLVSAAAAVTKNLTFGITQSLTYEHPFTVARRFSTLDHLTDGRVAINVVTSFLDSAAKNHGFQEQISHDERYVRAHEYLDSLYQLWESSWREDAVVLDKKTDTYTDPSRVRKINFHGKYYDVEGPHSTPPSPQRTPVIYQAGASTSGLGFAAKHSEAVFLSNYGIPKIRSSVDTIRTLASKEGRDPYSINIILGVTIIVAETDELAKKKHQELLETASSVGALVLLGGWLGLDFSVYKEDDDLTEVGTPGVKGFIKGLSQTYPAVNKWTVKSLSDTTKIGGLVGPLIVGAPTTVADELSTYIEEGDVDGFNIAYVTQPGSFIDIVELLVPELQRRGVHWSEYPVKPDGKGLTAREGFYGVGQSQLRDDHPGAKYKWKAAEEAPFLN
ncbi:Nitrilotriacetate monooxygenase component A/pristinamycin IIA synthase subunit A [Meredithblackwellia eburnea MCA 4105]